MKAQIETCRHFLTHVPRARLNIQVTLPTNAVVWGDTRIDFYIRKPKKKNEKRKMAFFISFHTSFYEGMYTYIYTHEYTHRTFHSQTGKEKR